MNPYVSFVAAARNDNYGGNFLHRMQVFVNGWASLVKKFQLPGELVIVEWNPPPENPRLKDALQWPDLKGQGAIRIVEVPAPAHKRFPNSERMPMFEYVAKNTGIRRAEGEYVLATNPDLLFSEELMQSLSRKELSTTCFYRADRYDVNDMIPLQMPVEQQLQFCEQHAFRVSFIYGTVPLESASQRIRNFLRSFPKSLFSYPGRRMPKHGLHTNASGDFLMMAREKWHQFRGYPELKTHSYVDGYGCFLAASLGLKQVLLKSPIRIYHQEHDRSAHAQRPSTDYQKYLEDGFRMLEQHRPEIYNDEHWGLGNEQLPEYRVSG